jgi:hypothetical protein
VKEIVHDADDAPAQTRGKQIHGLIGIMQACPGYVFDIVGKLCFIEAEIASPKFFPNGPLIERHVTHDN